MNYEQPARVRGSPCSPTARIRDVEPAFHFRL